jgi:hypothetical protein
VIFYPSIGNEEYPYTDWKTKRKDYSWNLLENIGETYHNICRGFRNKWNWHPEQCDILSIPRITRIYNELLEDIEKEQADNGSY